MSMFDSTKTPLKDILADITAGKIQLPDFQRGWVWDDEHIRSLLVSIAQSFPVGAVMLLEAGGDFSFKVRPIENIKFPGTPPEPESLVLDGQQRLTSLAQVLSVENPVSTYDHRGTKISRHYYIDIAVALHEGRLEDAFIAVPENRKIKTNFNRDIVMDLSTRELEIRNFHFPCSQILNSNQWEYDLSRCAPDRLEEYFEFRENIVETFRHYTMPIITLGAATTKEAVCLVFEKVNTGGIPLSVFDLVTAKFSAEGFNLRDDWFGSKANDVQGRRERLANERIMSGIESTDFLQTVSILHTYENRMADIDAGKRGKMVSAVSAKRASILSLNSDVYQKWASKVEEGFQFASKFMRKQHFFDARELPYRPQLVPLAAVLSKLRERWLEPRIYDRLSRWFWCGVLGELYGGAVETRIANDFEDLHCWLELEPNGPGNGSSEELPRTISEAAFQESRLDTLRSRSSAAYKGLSVLVLREGSRDFFLKEKIEALNYEEISLDIHHIFPRSWCQKKGIKRSVYDSIVNKTPISSKANKMIGSKAPSRYLGDLQSHPQVGLAEREMNDILHSHRIPVKELRSDDFNAFYSARKNAFIKLVEDVLGKPVQRDQDHNVRASEDRV